jgi:myo-inositol-1(or 4)-monophosphatase
VPDARLEAVAAAAAEAGRLALGLWDTDFRRWEKARGELVCEVDLAVDALLRERLTTIDPEAGWLSEETKDDPARLCAARVWVVDPIDGTRDYLRRRPGWCVSVALVEGGRPALAVLDAPARGEQWRAAAGQGATRDGVAVHASTRTALVGARTPADTLPRTEPDLVGVPRPNSIALRIAMVAANEADFCATLRWGHEWDIAAAMLVAEEAGAAVSDAFGNPIRYNSTKAEQFGLLVTAPAIHAEAVARLAPYAGKARERRG